MCGNPKEKFLSFTNKMNSELGGFHKWEVYKSQSTCELDLHGSQSLEQSLIFLG